jgi:hypothetical protein
MIINKNEYIVDRIEEDYIIIMDSVGNTININKEVTLKNVREGDIIMKCNNGYKILNKKGNRVREKVENKMKGMWEE